MAGLSILPPDIAVDIGTNNTRVYVKGEGIVVNEPSLVVVKGRELKRAVAIGDGAEEMVGRFGDEYKLVRPLKNGIIDDYELAQTMVHFFVNKAIGRRRFLHPRAVLSVPGNISAVAHQSFVNTMNKIGIKQVYKVQKSFAAAIGTGLRVYEPQSSLIMDIGAGATEISLISLGGIVLSYSVPIGGNSLDEAIFNYLRKNHDIIVTDHTAEQIKFDIMDITGEDAKGRVAVIRGRDVVTSMPITVDVQIDDIVTCVRDKFKDILAALRRVLERVPPEMCADVVKNGIYLSGGTSGLPNLDVLIANEFGIQVSVAREGGECTILGAGYLADHYDMLSTRQKKTDRT